MSCIHGDWGQKVTNSSRQVLCDFLKHSYKIRQGDLGKGIWVK